MTTTADIIVIKAPDDPDEKKVWARQMARVQIAMWVDGALACPVCKVPFKSVDDYLERNPRAGNRGPGGFDHVDSACWPNYKLVA